MILLEAIAAERGPFFIVGSCKNAGKTTLLNHLNQQLFTYHPNRQVAVTTIGRDGEAEDEVWRHPKPPVQLWPGNLFVTTEELVRELDPDSASYIETLPFQTTLGKLVIARALTDTHIETIGPDTNSQIWETIVRLQSHGTAITLVDGAFERRTQVAAEDDARLALVVSSDLAQTPEKVAAWLKNQIAHYDLPRAEADLTFGADSLAMGLYWRLGKQWGRYKHRSDALYIAGPFTDRHVDEHIDKLDEMDILLDDPTKIFLEERNWRRLTRRGNRFWVKRRTRLLLVGVNPKGLLRHFDAQEFFDKVRAVCPDRPVIDVVAGLYSE